MSLEDLREELSRRANAVQEMAGRLKTEIEEARRKSRLDDELDRLFMDLGIEVYQRMRADDPVEDSAVVKDLVDRVAAVELRLLETVDETGDT